MLDSHARIATWNENAEHLLGYPAEDILGRDFTRLFDTQEAASGSPANALHQAARTGQFEFSCHCQRSDGREFRASVTFMAVRSADGEVSGYCQVIRNVTVRPLSVEQMRLALEAAPTGMLLMDENGVMLLVNEHAEKLFGYPRYELLGKKIENLVPARYREQHPMFRQSFFGDPKIRAMGRGRELFALRKDGIEVPVEIGLNPLHTPDGRYVLSSVVDITERKRSVEQFRLAIEASPTGMLMMDEQGQIVLVNVQIEKLFGYPRQELLGQKIEMLVPNRYRDSHPGSRQTFFGQPRARAMGAGRDLYGLRKDGSEVPIEIGLNPLRTPEGSFVLSSVVDITERMRANQERDALLGQLRSLNADLELRVSERTAELTSTLRERDVLLQEIHHRVKNNLQVISSLINLQLRQLSDPTSRGALEECQTRVQAIALIHEKLYQSRDYSRVPFSEYARGLAGNVFHALGVSNSKVTLELAIESLLLGVDKAIPCGLILNELITNCLKHAFPQERKGCVRVELSREGGDAVLRVSDDGVGMPPELLPQESASLGMSLIHTLVGQLEGRIQIDKQPGTSVRVAFPVEGTA